jgi:hypothetical protein
MAKAAIIRDQMTMLMSGLIMRIVPNPAQDLSTRGSYKPSSPTIHNNITV